MSFAFSETDDYAEIVDEEDTYTMPSSKSPDCLVSDAGDCFCHAGEFPARPSGKVNGDGGAGSSPEKLVCTESSRNGAALNCCWFGPRLNSIQATSSVLCKQPLAANIFGLLAGVTLQL